MTWLKVEAPEGIAYMYRTEDNKYEVGCFKGYFGDIFCLKNTETGKTSTFKKMDDAQRAAWVEEMWGGTYVPAD